MPRLSTLLTIGLVALALLSVPQLVRAPQGGVVAPPRAVAAGSLSGVAAPQGRAPLPTALPFSSAVPPEGVQTDLGYQIDGYLNELVNSGRFQGQVLVARQGQGLVNKGYGLADAASGTPNTAATRIRLASLSKQFTAAAIMRLVAQDRLSISDPVCRFFNPCPAAWQPLTVRHLLNHTSGLPNYTDFPEFDATEQLPTTPQELVSRFRDMPLGFAPGSAFSYNNSGYLLLGLIIEQVSGTSYEQFLQQELFAPLGMADTGVDHNAGAITAGAVGHAAPGVVSSFLDASTLFGAGALYSSAADLYRWDQALYGDSVLPAAQRAEMFTPGLSDYGYGWWVQEVDDRRVISHPGNIAGFSTFMARFPNERVTVIVLGNLVSVDGRGIAMNIAEMVRDPQ